MDREVPFDEKAICDGCGAIGAFDFMGDFFCQKCLAEDDITAQQMPAPMTSEEFLKQKGSYPVTS